MADIATETTTVTDLLENQEAEAEKKDVVKILLLENVSKTAVTLFEDLGYQVDCRVESLGEEELKAVIGDYHVVGIRSKSNITEAVLREAKKLMAIGCFCIGTNQVDLKFAQRKGIPVFNSPFSNSRSVAELVIAEIIALSRQSLDRNNEMHESTWNKVVQNCYEIRGKTLGIAGYGHIGSQLSVLAEALGMHVIAYDILPLMPLGTAKFVSTLEELLANSDFVSLHVPETSLTKNIIGDEQLNLMKQGSYLINNARGSVVDLEALAAHLKSGHLAGAAVDVFPKEPAANGFGFDSDLQGCKNVIMTPHIGGSTEEAQLAIGIEVAAALSKYLSYGTTKGSVNFPEVELKEPVKGTRAIRILNVHQNVPGVLKQINRCLGRHVIIKQISDSLDSVGYLVADIAIQSGADMEALFKQICAITENIQTRFVSLSSKSTT